MIIYNWNKIPKTLEKILENSGHSWDWDVSSNGKSQYITIFYTYNINNEIFETELIIRFSDHYKTRHDQQFSGFNLGKDNKNWKIKEAGAELLKILVLLGSTKNEKWQYLNETDI